MVHAGGRPRVWSDEELQKKGQQLLEWCRQDGNWHISGFEDEFGVAVQWCYNMSRTKPEFKRVYKRAKAILGRKIMALVMEKSGPSPWMQATLLPFYLEDVNKHIDSKIEKKIELEAKAKMSEQDTVSTQAVAIITAANILAKGTKIEKPAKPKTD